MKIKIEQAYKALAQLEMIAKTKSIDTKSLRESINDSQEELMEDIRAFNKSVNYLENKLNKLENKVEPRDILEVLFSTINIRSNFENLESDFRDFVKDSDLFSTAESIQRKTMIDRTLVDLEEQFDEEETYLKSSHEILSSDLNVFQAKELIFSQYDEESNSFLDILHENEIWVPELFEELLCALQFLILKTATIDRDTKIMIFKINSFLSSTLFSHMNPSDSFKMSAYPEDSINEFNQSFGAICEYLLFDIRKDEYFWDI